MNLFYKKSKTVSLHKSLLVDAPFLKEIDPLWLDEKNEEGLTPIELAEFLNRKEFLKIVAPLQDRYFLLEKGGVLEKLSVREFEKRMEIQYLPYLKVSKYSILKKIVKNCRKALKQGLITREQKWQGSYYSKEIFSHYEADCTVRWIDDVYGYGLFSNQQIKKRSFVGKYTGLLRKYKKRTDKNNCYCFEYVIGERVTTPYTIDAQDQGNLMRFINHSDNGNLDPMMVYAKNTMHVIFYANRLIQKGEQLTYDYGPEYWAKREDPECS
jgi:uncharacterized protein